MAKAVRPAVLLIVLASVLFLVDGLLDGVYPGGSHWSADAYSGLGWTGYLFAMVSAVAAALIARGSERMLALRIGLAAFFLIERPASAFALGAKSIESVTVHLATAAIELVIFAASLRLWRLGRSVAGADLDALLQLSSAGDPGAPGTMDDTAVRSAEAAFAAEAADAAGAPARAAPVRATALPTRSSWLLGILTMLLAATLVADGVLAGYLPGNAFELDASGWLVYVFALVVLTVATRAVHGGRVALRLLLVLSLVFFLERAFTPFVLRIVEPVALALHLVAAFVALALALVTVGAIRSAPPAARAAQTI